MGAESLAAGGGALLAGATPFGWAQLGMSLLGGAAKGTPAGPSSSNAIFGDSMLNADSSGWIVNMGDGATSNLDNGNRGAPSQTPSGASVSAGGALASLPWMYILGAGLLGLLIWKKA